VSVRVGIDTGGTFTDLIAVDADMGRWQRAKVSSTPHDPGEAVISAFHRAELPLDSVSLVVIGTTVGTNALIQRRGAKVAYLTTEGFEDVPFIQRGNRRLQYDLHWRKPQPFLERWQCLGVHERLDYRGRVVCPLDARELDNVVSRVHVLADEYGIEAVAVNFLHSYANPAHEILVAKALSERLPEMPVSLSHEVASVWREYERGITTIADAYLRPTLQGFVGGLGARLRDSGFTGTLGLLRSNGGTQLADRAARTPIQLTLSGLAGGVLAGKRFGLPESANLITFDMGGTSCDIAVITNREHRYAESYDVEFGLPLTLPAIEVTTIGAGGGSIAWLDRGGFLRIGPQSAGAVPGPACYARGGSEPTVTDANLVLGRLDPENFLGGDLWLDVDASHAVLARLGHRLGLTAIEAALAVVAIADENMVNAIRVRTVEVGIDPRDYCLVAFGGAGALHAVSIARRLGIARVLVPPHPGLCSAFGALAADLRSDQRATTYMRSNEASADEINAVVSRLRSAAADEVRSEGFEGDLELSTRISMRYLGQNYEHEVELGQEPIVQRGLRDAFARFQTLHETFYGYHLSGQVLEIVRLAVTAVGRSTVPLPSIDADASARRDKRSIVCRTGARLVAPVVHRGGLRADDALDGPAVIVEADATTLLDHGDRLVVLENGSLLINVTKEE
jgi:N-methylhydantoinase A